MIAISAELASPNFATLATLDPRGTTSDTTDTPQGVAASTAAVYVVATEVGTPSDTHTETDAAVSTAEALSAVGLTKGTIAGTTDALEGTATGKVSLGRWILLVARTTASKELS